MPIKVNGPDGLVVNFPDGTDAKTIDRAMTEAVAAAKVKKAPSQRGSMIDPLVQGLTLGAGDEIKAGVRAGAQKLMGSEKPLGELYDKEVAATRADLAGFKERNPWTATGLEIGGGAVGVLASGGASLVPRAATTAGRLAAGVAESAGIGGLYGFNAGEGGVAERAPGAAVGAATGALTGGVVGSVAAKAATREAGKSIPTSDSLRAAGQQLYKQAGQVGLVVSKPAWNKAVQNIALKAKGQHINSGNHPEASAALTQLLKSRTAPKSLEEIDLLRQLVKDAEKSAIKSGRENDARLAGDMVDMLDQQLARFGPADAVSGDPILANKLILGAREVWTKKSKGEIIDDIFANAEISAGQYSQSGMENALRAQFASLAKNKNRMRQFSKEEAAAIRRAAVGGKLETVFRMLGKAAIRGPVSAVPSMAAMGFDPTGLTSAVIAGVGEAGRRTATNMRIANAERAGQMVRNGGPVTPVLTNNQRRLTAAGIGAANPAALDVTSPFYEYLRSR